MKRVYIRATYLSLDEVQFEIPSWNDGKPFLMKLMYLPYSIRLLLHDGFACYVQIDEAALESRKLQLKHWSLHLEI